MIIEGNVSVKAAILAGRRDVKTLYVDRDTKNRDTKWIVWRARERGIEVKEMPRSDIDAMAAGRTHGGLLAECGLRTYQNPQDCLKGTETFIAILEGVEDPFNLGYVMRSLYSAGCTGVLIGKRDWSESESTILKSSAGASEYMNIVMCEDLPEVILQYRNQGVSTFAAMRNDSIPYTEGNYTGPVLIAIGGELRGLSSGVRKVIGQNIHIPYANDFRMALNAAGAAAVLGFEVFRQRNSCS
ncbi:MAG: TrmH family RNA methyltransferase [Bulleidia sp.]